MKHLFFWNKQVREAELPQLQQGFTVVELIVILAIFAIMAAVALFNFTGFRNTVALSNLVHDVALEIKTAQTLGISASGDIDGQGGGTQRIVSVFFDNELGNYAKNFTTYREVGVSGWGVYNGNSDLFVRNSQLFGGSIERVSVCVLGNCSPLNDAFSISFRRPDPEPIITSSSCSGGSLRGFNNQICNGSIHIQLVAEDNSDKKSVIVIEPSGQIRVE